MVLHQDLVSGGIWLMATTSIGSCSTVYAEDEKIHLSLYFTKNGLIKKHAVSFLSSFNFFMESARSEKETQTQSSSNLSRVTVKESANPDIFVEKKDKESQQVTGADAKTVRTQRILTFIGLELALVLAALDE